jgi:type IV pilus assembly protein PilA
VQQKKRLRSKLGFALIELMVVVGIIGVLAGIAIPAYSRFQFKSKQTEAKTNLAGLFTTMKAFQAENSAYTARFDALGFNMDGKMRYRIGFAGDVAPPVGTIPQGTATCIVTANPGYPACDATYVPGWIIMPEAVNVPGMPATPFTPTSFKAYAVGFLDGVKVDSWSIDEKRNLLNQ